MIEEQVDVLVVGGGPAGSTAAWDLARKGHSVLLLDRDGRVKPCGGAVPPQLMTEFDVPSSLLVNRVDCARMVSPVGRAVDIPIENGYVGMVDREVFDEWLRQRAVAAGAERRTGIFTGLATNADGSATVTYRDGNSRSDRTVAGARPHGGGRRRGALGRGARRRFPARRMRASCSPITRSSSRPPPGTPRRRAAATCTTTAVSRPISTPGSSRMVPRRASAPAA